MKIQPKNKKKLLDVALGRIPADFCIKNVQLVNVFTGEVYPAHVYLCDRFIAHVESENLDECLIHAKQVMDGMERYLIPGLIDAHVHIESSMMTPRNFARAVVPFGTTTVVTDPHEIANVYGKDGVIYMHDIAKNLPMRQFVDIPSCIPSVPTLEHGGAAFFADDIEELSRLERVIGLAEVMDFVAVVEGEQRMNDIIEMAERRNLYLQGHAPFVSGRMLSAYLCGGPHSCHESRGGKESLMKLRNGMFVDARDSSIAKNVKAIVEGVKGLKFYDYLCLCTDDREADEILNHGHINDVVNHAIECGLDPITAIRCATLNTAREIKVDNIGAIAPGYVADMLLVEKLEKIIPTHVFFEGQLVAKDGELVVDITEAHDPLEDKNSMIVKPLNIEDFCIKAPIENGKIKTHVMTHHDLLLSDTSDEMIELDVVDGKVQLHDENLKYVAVVNRHPFKDTIGLGIVKGFGTHSGALASTVSHDCHNLTIVYDHPENALLAAKELIQSGGGMCAVLDGKILHTLALPLAGLMSLKPAEELAEDAKKMKQANEKLGLVGMDNPLLRIVTLALPVIPNVKMSDLGLIDVLNKQIIPLFEEAE